MQIFLDKLEDCPSLVDGSLEPAPATTVLLVRHAEKETGRNPGLTSAGQARARALVEVAKGAGVSAIYHTQLERTRQTAAPLASALGLQGTVIAISSGEAESHAREVARDILKRHEGEVVLVVGHSHTLPLIIKRLGAPLPPAIAEADYDNAFIVVKRRGRPGRLFHCQFGE